MKHTVFQVQLDSCIELNIRHHLDPKLATQVDALMLSITCNEERATCCCCFSYSVMFNCLQPHGLQLSRFLCSWDFLGKHTGVGRHFLLQGIFPTQELNLCLLHWQVDSLQLRHLGSLRATWGLAKPISKLLDRISQTVSSVTQSCQTLCYPMHCSMPGFPVHHQFPEPTQTHAHWVSDAIQPSHPLLSLSPPAFDLSQPQGLLILSNVVAPESYFPPLLIKFQEEALKREKKNQNQKQN